MNKLLLNRGQAIRTMRNKLSIQYIQEREDFWVAFVPEMPGVIDNGHTKDEAILNVMILAYRVMLDDLENNDVLPDGFVPHFKGFFGEQKEAVL